MLLEQLRGRNTLGLHFLQVSQAPGEHVPPTEQYLPKSAIFRFRTCIFSVCSETRVADSLVDRSRCCQWRCVRRCHLFRLLFPFSTCSSGRSAKLCRVCEDPVNSLLAVATPSTLHHVAESLVPLLTLELRSSLVLHAGPWEIVLRVHRRWTLGLEICSMFHPRLD